MSRKALVLDLSSPDLLQDAEDYLNRLGSRVRLVKELLDNNWRHLDEDEKFTAAREDMLDNTVNELQTELEIVTASMLTALRELRSAPTVGAR
jgi:hypothetical protein